MAKKLLVLVALTFAASAAVLLLAGPTETAGAQFLEGTVLSPRILGRSVNLHPVWVLLAVIAGGSLFGFIGMLVAVPTAAAIQVFARHWIAAYKGSAVYRGDGPAPERAADGAAPEIGG